MSIFHILGGKVSRVNYLRKIVDKDLQEIRTISNIGPEYTLLHTEFFVYTVIYELFNPDNNILIKHSKNITEDDMHSLVCVLINHYILDFKNKTAVNCILKELENYFNYTKEESDAFTSAHTYWNNMVEKNNKTSKLQHPTIKLIIQYGHANSNPILNNKVTTVLINAHNRTKVEINSTLARAYDK